MIIKAALVGAHSTGKTTLLKKLKENYPSFNYVSEVARDCPFPLNEKTTFESQEWILRKQIQKELDVPLNDFTISDRSVYDQLAYVSYAVQNGNISHENGEKLRELITTWGMSYDYIFYIPIEFPVVDDGFRSIDEVYRSEIDLIIKNILKVYVGDHRKMELHGTVEERLETMKNKIFEIANGGTS